VYQSIIKHFMRAEQEAVKLGYPTNRATAFLDIKSGNAQGP
jgi:hypothetical protein